MSGQFFAHNFFHQGFWAAGFWANTTTQPVDESGLSFGQKPKRVRRKKYSEFALENDHVDAQISAKQAVIANRNGLVETTFHGLPAFRNEKTGQIVIPKGAWTDDDLMLLMLIAAVDD